MTTLVRRLRPWAVALAILLVWEVCCRALAIPEFILPRPSRILDVAVQYHTQLELHAMQTLVTTIAGFAIALVVGVLLGVAVGSSEAVYESAYPLLVGFNAIPKVAIVPLIVIWTGIGTLPAIVTAFFISFFPIVVNVATGLSSVEPEIKDVLRVLGASKTEVLLKVSLPRALPYLFASIKVAIPLAFIGSVVSETIASNFGIGFLILSASSRFQVALIFAAVIVIAILSIIMFVLCVQAERRFAGWAFRNESK